MPAITYSDWQGGLDRRLPLGIQEANRLYTLKNAYITAGKKIRKRPGLRLITDQLTGSVGLEALNGSVCVFAEVGSSFVQPSDVGLFSLTPYNPIGLSTELRSVSFAKLIGGFPYVVAKHYTNEVLPYPPGFVGPLRYALQLVTRHHYIDGSPSTLVTDTNCSHGESATIAASRVFTIGGEVVRYSAAGEPRDWTTSSDAGFLPTTLQNDQRTDCTAVGTFRKDLVVFFEEGAQLWTVNVDPTANELTERIESVGTTFPLSLSSFYQDLAFVSPYGIRSIAVQQSVDRIDENDIGVPIDSFVTPSIVTHQNDVTQVDVIGIWLQQFGQYWVMFNAGGFTRVYAYSFSRSSKLACWSIYDFPVLLTGATTAAGKVYVRSASTLYELDPESYTDDGESIPVDVQMAFQDAKLPGVEKMFYGADFVFEGTATVSYLYDPRDVSKETNDQTIEGDTRAGTMVPVEISSAAIAPRFQHNADEAFELAMVTLYYHPLSAQSS